MTLSPEELARGRELLTASKAHLSEGPWVNRKGWIDAPSALPDGSAAHVADVRGWGYLTGRGHALALNDDTAYAAQMVWGDLIVFAVNNLPALLSAAASLAAERKRADEAEKALKACGDENETLETEKSQSAAKEG